MSENRRTLGLYRVDSFDGYGNIVGTQDVAAFDENHAMQRAFENAPRGVMSMRAISSSNKGIDPIHVEPGTYRDPADAVAKAPSLAHAIAGVDKEGDWTDMAAADGSESMRDRILQVVSLWEANRGR